MSSQPSAAAAIPFTRGSTLATMADAKLSASQLTAGTTTQVQLQTNAFLESLILDVTASVPSTNSATVVFAADAPFSVISQIKLDDPAGQSIIAPITGFQLFTLNKYLPDTDCDFDPCRDPNYSVITGSGATGGGFSFRLVVPIEYRRRDALGALNNSAANQRYLLTITTLAAYSSLYTTAPTAVPTGIAINVYQQYWTSPPASITTSAGSSPVQATPSGLGTVAFVRYERHNEVSGGGQPQIQLNNVGDVVQTIIWTLRDSSNVRDQADWPTEFDWWVNDFQVHALSSNDWQRWSARFYGLYGAATAKPTAGSLDNGVYPMFQFGSLFDQASNFGPANQLLPTDATTKLQVRGSTWGSGASYLEVLTRMIRPVSGAALYA
jgi:hypothetical protein